MIWTIEEAIKRVAVFEDSPELASELIEFSTDANAVDAYFMREAAEHIEGQFDLIRSLVHHLKRLSA